MTRNETRPGGYALNPGEDEIPTRPEAVDPSTLIMVRVYEGLTALERRHVVALLKAWQKCTLDQRVIIEAVAREFAPPDS